jgi:hypothetical protein
MKTHRFISSRKERGQSLTELAIVMAFLLILLAGIVDIGRAFFTFIELRDVAQEGALIGAIESLDCTEIETRVSTSTDSLQDLISNNIVEVSCDPADPSTVLPGNNITITVSYDDFPLTMPFLGTLIGSQTVDISASIIETVVAR